MLDRLITALRGGEQIATVSPHQAHSALSSGGCVLIDVRTIEEFAAGHAPGARCIPLQDLPQRAADIPRDQPVYLCCAAGRRSAAAARKLKEMGYDNAIDVAGGFGAWRAAGLPVAQTE